MNQSRLWILAAALLGAGGVALGAFQAHGLERHLQRQGDSAQDVAEKLEWCGTAVQYQLIHALALLGLGLLARTMEASPAAVSRWGAAAGVLMTAGIIMFAGGLYTLVFFGRVLHWSVIPAGGLLLILSWLALGLAGLLARGASPPPR